MSTSEYLPVPRLKPVTEAGQDKITALMTAMDKLTDSMTLLTTSINSHVKESKKARKNKKVEEIRRDAQTTVYVRVIFLKIGEIDTVHEHFEADVFIQAKWKEPKLNTATRNDLDNFDPDQYWNPRIYVENLLPSGANEDIWHKAVKENGQAVVYEKRRVKGKMVENMELEEFPFDTQKLNVIVMSQRPSSEISLVSGESDFCGMDDTLSFVDQQQWKLHKFVEVRDWISNTHMAHVPKIHRSGLAVWCTADRRPQFFIWNIAVVMIFICCLSFATFSIDVGGSQTRLIPSFTLVLTMITFKYTVNQSLPQISYLTYLDWYILVSMVFLCCVAIWHAIGAYIADADSISMAEDVDYYVLVSFACFYFAFHVIFAICILYKARKTKLTLEEKNMKYQERLAKLLHGISIPFPEFSSPERRWRRNHVSPNI